MKRIGIIGIVLILALLYMPAVTAKSPPKTVYQCEIVSEGAKKGTEACGTWTLQNDGVHYSAKWDNGARARLTISSWGPEFVVISRLDSNRVLRGTYSGVLDTSTKSIIDGQVTWMFHKRVVTGTWNAEYEE
jgi:hypothetical protein